MLIHDELLNALADRWDIIPPDFQGQTFEAWLCTRMLECNEFGYGDICLWNYVVSIPDEELVTAKAEAIRTIGGTFVQRIEDLTPLAKFMLS